MKSKKLMASFIVGLTLVIVIPSAAYGYSTYNYNKLYTQGQTYLDKEKFDEAIASYISALKYKTKNKDVITKQVNEVNEIKRSKEIYDKAIKETEGKQYVEAIDDFKNVSKKDSKRYESAQSKINECKSAFINDNIMDAKKQADSKKYEIAIGILDKIIKFDPSYQDAIALKSQYEDKMAELKAEEEKSKAAVATQNVPTSTTSNKSSTQKSASTSANTNNITTQTTSNNTTNTTVKTPEIVITKPFSGPDVIKVKDSTGTFTMYLEQINNSTGFMLCIEGPSDANGSTIGGVISAENLETFYSGVIKSGSFVTSTMSTKQPGVNISADFMVTYKGHEYKLQCTFAAK